MDESSAKYCPDQKEQDEVILLKKRVDELEKENEELKIENSSLWSTLAGTCV